MGGRALEWEPTSRADPTTSLLSFATGLTNSSALPPCWVPHLDELVYCIMKSLSFQFALMDVLRALQDEFEMDSLPTIPSDGMEYAVTLGEAACDAHVHWRRKAKIFTVDIETSEKRFYGAIESLCTTFRFPVVPGYVQTYHVEMRVPKRRLGLFQSKVSKNVTLVTDSPLMRAEAAERTPLLRETVESPSRARCSSGCGRLAARGRGACCRTCVLSERARHGPTCDQRTARAGEGPETLCSAVPDRHAGRRPTSDTDSSFGASPSDEAEELLPLVFAVDSATSS